MGRWITDAERVMLQAKLAELASEHRDLDAAIRSIEATPMHDQLQVRRMKKRKLVLKDEIGWIERQLQPDEPA